MSVYQEALLSVTLPSLHCGAGLAAFTYKSRNVPGPNSCGLGLETQVLPSRLQMLDLITYSLLERLE